MNLVKTTLTLIGILSMSQALPAHEPIPLPRHQQLERHTERREVRQQHRIAHGVRSGALTPMETARLERQQARIDRSIDRAEADGHVTAREAARVHHQQDMASHRIYRKKHNARQMP